MKYSHRGINVYYQDKYYITSGLSRLVGHELKLLKKNKLEQEYLRVLQYLINYILDEKPVIKNSQTISYYSWLIKVIKESSGYFAIFEANNDGSGFDEGADTGISIINEQEYECKKYNETPYFPTFNQKIAISKGVYEGLPVDAVRYPSPGHMTGWWITTDLYNNDINSLMVVHYYHVAFKRPDILRYLALPFGYRLQMSDSEKLIWFDEKVKQ